MEFLNFWQRLTKPDVSLLSTEDRRKSRLLSGLLVFLMLTISIGIISGLIFKPPSDPLVFVMLIVLFSMVISYRFSRTKYYQISAAITLTTLSLFPVVIFLLRGDYSPYHVSGSLIWLLIPITLSSVLFSFRFSIFFISFHVVGALALPWLIGDIEPQVAYFIVGVFTSVAAVVLTSTYINRQNTREVDEENRKFLESENQFRTLISNYPDGVALIVGQNIIYANPALCEMIGYAAQEIVNKPPGIFLTPEDEKRVIENLKRLLKGGRPYPSEYSGIKKNKTVFPVEVRSQIIEYNNKPALLCVLRDITKRKKAEEKIKLFNQVLGKKVKERTKELLVLNKELERANKVRAEFTANASHELRTPLAVIQSNLDLALREKSSKQVNPRETLSIINTEIKGITKIISDLALLSRVDAKEQRIERKKVKLDTIIKKSVKKARVLGKDKNISIDVERLDEVTILGDKDGLERLMMNLLGNAILYGKSKGIIEVKLSLIGSQAKIIVTDNGIGIPKKDLPFIFDRFFRVNKDRSRESGGTGLGLAISKWIVDVHGGKIRVVSTLGKGSKFTVHLPV